MTEYKATPEQWANIEGRVCDELSCYLSILELRARVEALEHRFDTQRLATLEWGKDVKAIQRWNEQQLRRIMALEAAQQQPEPIDKEENDRRFKAAMAAIDAATPEQIRAAAGLPERSSLVERVSCAIDGRINPDQWLHQDAARAAIREVAAWLREHYGGPTASSTALEQEAER